MLLSFIYKDNYLVKHVPDREGEVSWVGLAGSAEKASILSLTD